MQIVEYFACKSFILSSLNVELELSSKFILGYAAVVDEERIWIRGNLRRDSSSTK